MGIPILMVYDQMILTASFFILGIHDARWLHVRAIQAKAAPRLFTGP